MEEAKMTADVYFASILDHSDLYESLSLEEIGEKIDEIGKYNQDTLDIVKSRLDDDVITGYKYVFGYEGDRFTELDDQWTIQSKPVTKPVRMCLDMWSYTGSNLIVIESVFNDTIIYKMDNVADVERLNDQFYKIGKKYAFMIERPALRATMMEIIANMQKLQTATDDLHVLTVDFEESISAGEKAAKGMEEIVSAMRSLGDKLPTIKLSMNSREYIGYEQVPETLGKEDDSQFSVYGDIHDVVKHAKHLKGIVAFDAPQNLTKKRVFTGYHTSCIRGICNFVENGKSCISSCSDDGSIKIWNIEKGEVITKWPDHYASVNAMITFEQKGNKFLATGGNDNTIKVWNLKHNTLVNTLSGHTSYVRALSTFVRDGTLFLVSASADKTIKIWDLELNTSISNLAGHEGFVYALASYEKGSVPYLVSGGYDNKILVWNLATTEIVATLEGHTKYVWALAMYMDGDTNCLASSSADGTVRLWDLDEGEMIDTLTGHAGIVSAINVFVHDRAFCLASGDSKGMIKLWNLKTHQCIGDLKSDTGVFALSSFYINEQPVLAAGTYKDIEIWY